MRTQKAPPIGIDDFAELIDKNKRHLFVDKSLLISDLIDSSAKVTLITRPRRWGKTLNLSMLEYFFAPTVLDINTQGLFDDFAIASVEGDYLQYQGQYPVIFISFKDIKQQSFDTSLDDFKETLYAIYHRHEYLLNSEKLSSISKKRLVDYLQGNINQAKIERSLHFLSQCLYEHYQKRVYILIDEYDTPLNYAYLHDYIEPMTLLMKNLFSAALKGNAYLEKGVMTGILRISKNSMLSGLNNLTTFSILNEEYAQHFGFSDSDVSKLFAEMNLTQDMQNIRDYYNGYQMGDCLLYNPWSVMECLRTGGKLAPYWVNTANDDMLRNSLLRSSKEIKAQLQHLISQKDYVLRTKISETTRFDNLEHDETALWSLLLATGYLTQISKKPLDEYYECEVKIPNREVSKLYIGMFREWLLQKTSKPDFDTFMEDLTSGRIQQFTEKLGHYLLKYTSYHDLWHESSYHTFVTGLLCSLTDHYFLYSNPEAGLGRADVALVPKDNANQDAIIMEFKHDKKIKPSEKLAKQAIQQIDDQQYHEFVTSYQSIQRILKVGLAFNGKRVVSAYRWDDINGKPLEKVVYQKLLKDE